jgi:uncharacterized membrane protein YeaQ/YmgE (transglycosylase-associated protein family)
MQRFVVTGLGHFFDAHAGHRKENFMQYVYWLGIGAVVGWIAGKRNRGQGYRILISILMGMLGAIMAGLIMRAMGYTSQESEIYTTFLVVIGAAFMTILIGTLTGRGRFAGAP